MPEVLLDHVMDGHRGVPRPGDRRLLPDPAPVGTRCHSPSIMMYLPPLVWIPKVPTSRSQTAKSSWGAELKGLTSYRASSSSSEASRAS